MSNMPREIVITGVNGFVGEHLARHLKDVGFNVRGVGREVTPNDKVSPYLDQYSRADFLDATSVRKLPLGSAAAIIHLAGLASVSESFDKPDLYKTGNATMTDNLLTAAEEQGFSGRIVAVSTGALYDSTQPMPLNEDSDTIESSPYAIGKLLAEDVAKQHRLSGLDVVIARPFNHIGPGQGRGFLVPDLYEQLQSARQSDSKQILVGNLSTRRDYTDVRDIVRAYTDLATTPHLKHSTYNISSGASLTGHEILKYIKEAAKLTSIDAVIDQSKVRPTDAMEIVGDSKRINSELGWHPLSSPQTAINDFIKREASKL